MEHYALHELNEYIKRVIALNFDAPIWISCEISQISEVRGNVYLDLVEHDEDSETIIAQSRASIWYKSYLFIKAKLGELLPNVLQQGSKVLVKVHVNFHERYGMSLTIEDIDPAYTIGQMEMARQKIIERLKVEGLIGKNKETTLSAVTQNIAIISSSTAAGYIDFIQQIDHNDYGYRFQTTLFQSAMQGQHVERDVLNALNEIESQAEQYDCVIIIRGGGAKLDLAGFDNYNIAHKIAHFPIPIITGIGHEVDQTVIDLAAHTALKTPTAVAQFLIDRLLSFEMNLHELGETIKKYTLQKLESNKIFLEQASFQLKAIPKDLISNQSLKITHLEVQLNSVLKHVIKGKQDFIRYAENIIKLSSPEANLRKGYSIIQKNDQVISSSHDLSEGDTVQIIMKDGSLSSIIKQIKHE